MKAGKNQQVVMRFIDAVSDNDKERIQSFFADDSVFNLPSSEKTAGQQAISDLMVDMRGDAEQIDWQVDHLHEDQSGAVLTEGSVRYLLNGEWRKLEVNASFEVSGSKITQWH